MKFSLSEEVFWGIYMVVTCWLLVTTWRSLSTKPPAKLPACEVCANQQREAMHNLDALKTLPWQMVVPRVIAICAAWPYAMWLAIQAMPPRHQCTK